MKKDAMKLNVKWNNVQHVCLSCVILVLSRQ